MDIQKDLNLPCQNWLRGFRNILKRYLEYVHLAAQNIWSNFFRKLSVMKVKCLIYNPGRDVSAVLAHYFITNALNLYKKCTECAEIR